MRIFWPNIPVQLVALIIVVGVTTLAFRGAAMALKTQIPLLIFILISLVVLALGVFQDPQVVGVAAPNPSPPSYWVAFAIFFPAVTGIMAGLDSNAVLLGWPGDRERMLKFFQIIRRLDKIKKSVILGKIQSGLIPQVMDRQEIMVWWGGLQRNGDLMLLLSHLLSRNPEWRRSDIKILSIASNELMRQNTEKYLKNLINELRIDAEAQVTVHSADQSVREYIHERSAQADVVFLGLDIPEEEKDMVQYVNRIEELAEPLQTVFFVKNSSLFIGNLVQKTEEAPGDAPERSENSPLPEPSNDH